VPVDRCFIFDRLPGYSSAHGATIAERGNGELICAWFAGADHKGGNGVILFARRPAGAAQWQDVRAVAGMNDPRAYGNAALCAHTGPDGEERIELFFTRVERPEGNFEGRARGHDSFSYIVQSRDGGWTWSQEQSLRDQRSFLVKNKPLVRPNGELAIGAYSDLERRSWLGTRPAGGGTWRYGQAIAVPQGCSGAIQPALAAWPDGEMQMYLRTGDRRIWRSCSADGGRTWSEAEPTDLPNPDTGIDAQVLSDGRLLLAHNPTESARSPLALRVSEDRGRNWGPPIVLAAGDGEFSYPAIIEGGDGRVHLAYSHRRTRIEHVTLDPAEL
jgi:predicted neuraminidase